MFFLTAEVLVSMSSQCLELLIRTYAAFFLPSAARDAGQLARWLVDVARFTRHIKTPLYDMIVFGILFLYNAYVDLERTTRTTWSASASVRFCL
jgi:hypothetical protein